MGTQTFYESSPELNCEPQNSRIMNRRISKVVLPNTYLRHSIFIIHYSFLKFPLWIKLAALSARG
jgi:hypothetical protein